MADNEAKARKKLEEAQKKAKGGGGFLGSLFGGSRSDEAADLFVQEEAIGDCETAQVSANDEIRCMEKDCGGTFDNVVCYEEHYEAMHRHQCNLCGRPFVNAHRLEIHEEEAHSALFRAQLERYPQKALFRCWHEECSQIFNKTEQRDQHALEAHGIEDAHINAERRKLAKRVDELQVVMGEVKVSSRGGKVRKPPRAVVFGDDPDQQPMFDNIRALRVPFHRKNRVKGDK